MIFYLFIFSLPWHTIWLVRDVFVDGEKWQYGTIGIFVSDILLFVWMILSVYNHTRTITEWMYAHKKTIATLLLLELWIFASVLWSDDVWLALYRAVLFSMACDLFILLWIVPQSLRHITITFIISACLHAIIGIYQFLSQKTFANTYIGTQFHDIAWGGTATIGMHDERWLRAYGGMPHPNMLGGLLLAALLLAITLYMTEKHRSFMTTIMSLFACSILSYGILVTFSRTTWLIALISTMTLLGFFVLSTKKIFSVTTPLIIIFSAIAIFTLFFDNLLFTRIAHDTQLSHNSLGDRKAYLAHTQMLIAQHPLTGTGIGNYTNAAYNAYNQSHPVWYFQPVHNMYILMLAEIGIIGAVIALSLFASSVRSFYRTKPPKSPYHITCIVICFSLLITALCDHWLWSSHFGLFFLALFIGLALQQKKDAHHCAPSKA